MLARLNGLDRFFFELLFGFEQGIDGLDRAFRFKQGLGAAVGFRRLAELVNGLDLIHFLSHEMQNTRRLLAPIKR